MSLADDIAKQQNVKPGGSDPADGKAWATVGLDGGELSTGAMPTELAGDWDAVLRSFGLDPTVFEVADDTVRMSKWQSSKRLENGDRDLIWLWSYRAKFRRKSLTALNDAEIDDIRKYVHKWKPTSTKVAVSNGIPCTFVFNWADLQLGKSAGGGVDATVERMTDSISDGVKRIKELRKQGRNIEGVAFVLMGDPTEGCTGNYASQLFTVELTQRQQLLLALDLHAQAIRQFASMADSLDVVGVLCNHGEWLRQGGKAITSDSDNASGFLMDALFRILDGHIPNLKWKIPHDEMVTTRILSGVKLAFTHGHKITGKEIEWLRGQSIRVLREEGREPDIWVTAHKHHLQVTDFGPWYRFQCPSNDGGSKWYTDSTGNWSTPGTLTFLTGKHDPKGWSDMAVL
jgi:hypothetical protein